MKQKLLYICLMILCTFAWSGEVWGIDWKNDWSSAPSLNTSFYVYNVNNGVFLKSGGTGSGAVTSSASSATFWTYKNVQTSYWAFGTHYVDHYSLVCPNNNFVYFSHHSGTYDGITNETSSGNQTEILYDYSDGKFMIWNKVSDIQRYYLRVSGNALKISYSTSAQSYFEWYFVNQTQYKNHLAIEAYETSNNSVTTTYSSSNLPNTFYNQVASYLNSTTGYLNYSSWLSSTDKSSSINSATTSINNWLSTAAAMKTAYESALTTIATAKTNSTNNNPKNIAASDITDAETALEKATTTAAIADALKKIKNFDAITINVPETVEMGSSISNTASVSSGRSLTYTSSDNTVLSFSGSTVNALKPGEVTITVTTGSTGNNSSGKTYYHCTATKTVKVLPIFNFAVTPVKIYDHGTVEATVTGKVVGATPDVDNASVQASFTANPSTGCTFIGWYYDEAHTQLASTDATYYPQVINESAGSTKNLTLYAYFKANQAINFTNATYDKNVIVGELVSGAAAATASSGLDVSYSTSNATIATVNENGDVEGKAASNDDVTITVSQAGNDEYYAATSITRDFHVISKYQAVYTPSFTGSSPTIYVDDKPTITVSNTSDEFDFDSSDKTVVDISKSGNVITLTAKKAGTSEITLTQPETRTHSAVSATYNITVAKVANTLGVVLSGTSAQVDAAINVTFSEQNNTVTDILGEITEQSLSSDVNNGEDPQVITYANGVITACNAGTAKITFTQAETDKYAGFTSSIYEITVTKIGNPITITLAGGSATNIKLKYGATASLAYSSVNPASTVEVNRVSGNYSTCVNGTITAGNTAGTDLYEVIQAETYKYEAGYASFIIRVNNTDEALGYVLNDSQEYSHGTGSGVVHTYELSGPGETLYYSACRGTAVTIYYNMYVEYSTDNSNWKQAQDNTSLDPGYKDFSCSIPEDARYVRFRFPAGGTLVKYVKNVYVPRKTYFRPSVDKTDLGTVYTDQTATASFSIDYSTTNGGPIIVSTNNDHFAPSETSLTRADNSDGTKTFAVTYTPNPNSIGAESATITVGDLFNSKQYTLTATSAKRANTLAVIGEQDLMVDDEVQNVYSGKNSDASLICNPSKEGVVTFDADKNRIKAVGEGTVTLTFTQAENDYYNGATKSVTVKVSKYNQMLSWENELDGAARTLNIGDELTTNTATATSGLAVSYSSSNPTALEVNATTGKLIAKTGGSNIGITVTQAGNYKYNEAPSITRYFTIISRIDATVTTSLSETGNNTFPIGSEGITIGCNALLTESALSISGDENVVSVSFANNTFTLTALAEGTVTVALTRAEDDGYNAINKTYTIEVIKPVLVLNPSEAPVINYSDYSSVTYSGTLKSGYSTIALPFNTTVQDIVGNGYDSEDDWVAQLSVVTYNAHDGYSLYFSKSNTIEANQPYILHLGTAVDSPVFTNVSVVAAEEATQNATKGVYLTDWTMHSNYYDPAFDMNGYYGVVNGEGVLKKGTTGSTLKAFHAYITGPAAAPVKAAYLEEDEADAILELLNAEATEPENIYDLQGRQLPRAGKGINIIRNADGSVRKVLTPNR